MTGLDPAFPEFAHYGLTIRRAVKVLGRRCDAARSLR
jgi:hypothetical protein